MSRYQKYPAYKDSGVEWIGKIPEHWKVKRLKFVSIVQASNVDKKTIDGEFPVLLCNYSDVYNNFEIDSTLDFMQATATQEEIGKFHLSEGDVIVTKDSETPYDIAVPSYVKESFNNVICGYHLTQIKSKNMFGKYLFRLFQSTQFNTQFIVRANGVTRFGLPQYVINNSFIVKPPLEEQQAIASFLDRKTAQIDDLIAKKEALLKKLDEKCTVLIIQAVTKGIDPSVSMKDSGVVWLGEIPEHWEVKRLKFVSIVQPSNVDKKTSDGEFPVLLCNYSDVYNNFEIDSTLDFMQATATQEEIGKFHLSEGDVIVTKDSETPYDIAVPAYVRESFNDILCGYHLTQIKQKEMFGKYLFRLFQSTQFNAQFIVRANGVTRFGLPQYVINNAFIIKPPLEEQQAIAQYIDKKIAIIDRQKTQITEAIERLKEYRTALVTDAVTGNIQIAF
ncbi:MAG: restriction endonuclease subunit S [Chlorobiales bacterium]|nr:restriction endonuclease subunit S [Chlorobiales bacterium]